MFFIAVSRCGGVTVHLFPYLHSTLLHPSSFTHPTRIIALICPAPCPPPSRCIACEPQSVLDPILVCNCLRKDSCCISWMCGLDVSSREMQKVIYVLDKALLVLALGVDGRRGGCVGLLAARSEDSAADGYGQGCDCELYNRQLAYIPVNHVLSPIPPSLERKSHCGIDSVVCARGKASELPHGRTFRISRKGHTMCDPT